MGRMYLSRIKAEELLQSDSVNVEWLMSQSKNSEDKDLRIELRKIANIIKMKQFNWTGGVIDKSKIRSYTYDLAMGLEIYNFFKTNEQYKITLRDAASPEFWSYISIIVAPDIVSERWDLSNVSRYYLQRNRIWLLSLWWYIHLSWQGDIETTRKILEKNTTDTILNLVDRSGSKGYNLLLYRQIMKEYSLIDDIKQDSKGRDYFRSIMISNNLLTQTIEPSLYKNGIEDYVEKLFELCGLEMNGKKYIVEQEVINE